MTIALTHAARVRCRLATAAEQERSRVEALGRLVARSARARAWAGSEPERNMLLGRCVVGAVIASLLLASSTHGARTLAAVPLGACIGVRGGRAFHERGRRATEADVRRAVPVLLDRLATCVLAGMSIERALRVVAPGTPGALGGALAEGLRALDLGVTRARAYQRIAERAGTDEVRALVAALARAERFGTSVSAALVAQADEARGRARAAAETDARAVPVKLVFPLVFCFLPAFVLLTIAPIAIGAFRTLGGL